MKKFLLFFFLTYFLVYKISYTKPVLLLPVEKGSITLTPSIRLKFYYPYPCLTSDDIAVYVYPSYSNKYSEKDRCKCVFVKYFKKKYYLNIRGLPPLSSAENYSITLKISTPEGIYTLTRTKVLKSSSKSIDVVMLVDTSFSMRQNDPENMRISAIKVFFDIAQSSSTIKRIGIIKFSGKSSIILPLTPIEKINIDKIVENINAAGRTNIDKAIQKGLELLREAKAEEKVIILLTDGKNEPPPYKNAHLQAVEKNIRIYTIGLSEHADRKTLQLIARQTGGEFYISPTNKQLIQIYSTIAQSLQSQTLIEKKKFNFSKDTTQDLPVVIDSTISRVSFISSYDKGDYTFNAISPSGNIFRGILNIGKNSKRAKGMYDIIRIKIPEVGKWRYTIKYSQKKGNNLLDQLYWLKDKLNIASFESSYSSLLNVNVYAETTLFCDDFGIDEIFKIKEPVPIVCCVAEKDTPLVNLNVRAQITSPSGKVFTIDLYDRGNSGDTDEEDGIYGNYFMNTLEEGIYHVCIRVKGKNLKGEPFQRIHSYSFNVGKQEYKGLEVIPSTLTLGPVLSGEKISTKIKIRNLLPFPETITYNLFQLKGKKYIIKSSIRGEVYLKSNFLEEIKLNISIPSKVSGDIYSGKLVFSTPDYKREIPVFLKVYPKYLTSKSLIDLGEFRPSEDIIKNIKFVFDSFIPVPCKMRLEHLNKKKWNIKFPSFLKISSSHDIPLHFKLKNVREGIYFLPLSIQHLDMKENVKLKITIVRPKIIYKGKRFYKVGPKKDVILKIPLLFKPSYLMKPKEKVEIISLQNEFKNIKFKVPKYLLINRNGKSLLNLKLKTFNISTTKKITIKLKLKGKDFEGIIGIPIRLISGKITAPNTIDLGIIKYLPSIVNKEFDIKIEQIENEKITLEIPKEISEREAESEIYLLPYSSISVKMKEKGNYFRVFLKCKFEKGMPDGEFFNWIKIKTPYDMVKVRLMARVCTYPYRNTIIVFPNKISMQPLFSREVRDIELTIKSLIDRKQKLKFQIISQKGVNLLNFPEDIFLLPKSSLHVRLSITSEAFQEKNGELQLKIKGMGKPVLFVVNSKVLPLFTQEYSGIPKDIPSEFYKIFILSLLGILLLVLFIIWLSTQSEDSFFRFFCVSFLVHCMLFLIIIEVHTQIKSIKQRKIKIKICKTPIRRFKPLNPKASVNLPVKPSQINVKIKKSFIHKKRVDIPINQVSIKEILLPEIWEEDVPKEKKKKLLPLTKTFFNKKEVNEPSLSVKKYKKRAQNTQKMTSPPLVVPEKKEYLSNNLQISNFDIPKKVAIILNKTRKGFTPKEKKMLIPKDILRITPPKQKLEIKSKNFQEKEIFSPSSQVNLNVFPYESRRESYLDFSFNRKSRIFRGNAFQNRECIVESITGKRFYPINKSLNQKTYNISALKKKKIYIKHSFKISSLSQRSFIKENILSKKSFSVFSPNKDMGKIAARIGKAKVNIKEVKEEKYRWNLFPIKRREKTQSKESLNIISSRSQYEIENPIKDFIPYKIRKFFIKEQKQSIKEKSNVKLTWVLTLTEPLRRREEPLETEFIKYHKPNLRFHLIEDLTYLPEYGQIMWLKGKVYLIRSKQKSYLKRGEKVYTGDIVYTTNLSKVCIKFANNTHIILDNSTRLYIISIFNIGIKDRIHFVFFSHSGGVRISSNKGNEHKDFIEFGFVRGNIYGGWIEAYLDMYNYGFTDVLFKEGNITYYLEESQVSLNIQHPALIRIEDYPLILDFKKRESIIYSNIENRLPIKLK